MKSLDGLTHRSGAHRGIHRDAGGFDFVSCTTKFYFNTAVTADSSQNPNTLLYGNGIATFLLGALDGQSEMIGGPNPYAEDQYWGFYIQDDWKVSRRLTLNLGLRNEYETAWTGPNLSRGLDLNATVPQMAANPPVMPAAATSIEPAGFYSGVTKGLWQFDAPGRACGMRPRWRLPRGSVRMKQELQR